MDNCVFVKYGIKFENFYTNHPAIYLSFVIQNWLAVGIFPNIYKKDNILLENSRIELLQNNSLLLDILETIINCVLNIDIKLDENLYKKNIKALNNSKQFSKDEIVHFLSIENYMLEEDKMLFIRTLCLFFPECSISKSFDAVPCMAYLTSLKLDGVNIWGPSFWTIIHYSTFIVDMLSNQKEKYKNSLCSLVGFLDLLLPCVICRYHYASFSSLNDEEDFPRPYPLTLPYIALEFANKKQLFKFYSLLHNNCKPMTNKELLSFEYFKNLYKNFYQSSPTKLLS